MTARALAAVALFLLIPSGVLADSASLGGSFRLIDQAGMPRTDADFHGSYPLIYFGFTHCPDLCPRSLSVMSAALDELSARDPDKARRLALLFITVDPERDTVAVMKDYAAKFHPRLIGLTGTEQEIEHVTRSYGAFYAPVPEGDGTYAMDHSGFIVLMGSAGEYLTHFESDVRVDELVAELERRIAP